MSQEGCEVERCEVEDWWRGGKRKRTRREKRGMARGLIASHSHHPHEGNDEWCVW